jgi:hypothetical protein
MIELRVQKKIQGETYKEVILSKLWKVAGIVPFSLFPCTFLREEKNSSDEWIVNNLITNQQFKFCCLQAGKACTQAKVTGNWPLKIVVSNISARRIDNSWKLQQSPIEIKPQK